MRILRVFLKGFQGNYCEAPIPEGVTLSNVLQAFKMDGFLSAETPNHAPWAVPWDSWQFMAIITLDAGQSGPLAWSMPSPGEKPN
jgi:hypothetical protein